MWLPASNRVWAHEWKDLPETYKVHCVPKAFPQEEQKTHSSTNMLKQEECLATQQQWTKLSERENPDWDRKADCMHPNFKYLEVFQAQTGHQGPYYNPCSKKLPADASLPAPAETHTMTTSDLSK